MTGHAALAFHIETRHHARHREYLPALAAMAERVEAVRFTGEGVPKGLSSRLRQMIGKMEVPMRLEDDPLFPQFEPTDA